MCKNHTASSTNEWSNRKANHQQDKWDTSRLLKDNPVHCHWTKLAGLPVLRLRCVLEIGRDYSSSERVRTYRLKFVCRLCQQKTGSQSSMLIQQIFVAQAFQFCGKRGTQIAIGAAIYEHGTAVFSWPWEKTINNVIKSASLLSATSL